MTAPLAGVLVVALEQAVAAPLCTSRLADAGARVIKIERPQGDFARDYDHVAHGESAYFVWINRGKESLVADIKSPEDRALLERLVASADVFIQNLAPGAAERAGLGSAALRARHPRLITCDISGYGEDGPYRDMKAYDLLVQAETGLASITGAPEAPGRVGVSVADIACGMYAHAAILQALYARERSGEGAAIALSLFDSIADWMTVPLLHHDHSGRAPQRVGLNHPSIAPYGAFACADGRQVVLSIQNEREWANFCAVVLEQPAIASDPLFSSNTARVANRGQLDGLVAACLATLDLDQAIDRLNRAKIAFGRLNGVAELSSHPQLRRMAVNTPTGPVDVVAPPARWMDAPPARWMDAPPARWMDAPPDARPVPALGQQSQAIREEFSP